MAKKYTFKFSDGSTAFTSDSLVWFSSKPTHVEIGRKWVKYNEFRNI